MEKDISITIGIPRALLYYRYGFLWQTFFKELGLKTVVSSPTSRKILEDGAGLATDEVCLSLKLFLGHVKELTGFCDYILVPRISNFGWHRNLCVRFEALYDLTRNVFRGTGQKFLSYNVDILNRHEEPAAFWALGQSLGYSPKAVKSAYEAARKADQRQWKEKVRKEELLYQSEDLKILIVGHS